MSLNTELGRMWAIGPHELELASSSTALSVHLEFPPGGVWAGKAIQNVSTRAVAKVAVVCLTWGLSKSEMGFLYK